MNSPHFVYIADVFCPWCYGFGPIMKKISRENPAIPVKVIGGNLISRPITLHEDAVNSPGLVEFWEEVQSTTGRSLAGAINAVRMDKDVRLYSPAADEVLEALKRLCPGHELDQMLMLEDMFYEQGLDLFTSDSLEMLASRWNVDINVFENILDHDATLAAAERNLQTASQLMGEITSYPSVLLVRDGKVDAVSRGYVHYETVASRLADAIGDLGLQDLSPNFCSKHNGCTLGRYA